MKPLNPNLFARMQEYYGDVQIRNHGLENNWHIEWVESPGHDRRLPRRVMESYGEAYVVRCKACRDYRARLYINHRWGVLDPETRSLNLWLARCFHEECYSEYEEQRTLYDRLYETIIVGSKKPVHIMPGQVAEPTILRPVKLPGPTIRLDELAKRCPSHPALTYLHGRGFDPEKIGRMYGAGYCTSTHFHWATNRIIIPIYQAGMLVGWQARYIGDDVCGVPFNKAKVPKYWSCPRMPRRLIAYNLERALQHSTIVIVEGPGDVWRVGPMALAAMGKTVSRQVADLIVDGMKRHGDDGVVAVAFDADPGSQRNPRSRLKAHPTDVLVGQLRVPLATFGGKVVPIRLPARCDPGSMEREAIRELIREQAAQIGALVRYTRPR